MNNYQQTKNIVSYFFCSLCLPPLVYFIFYGLEGIGFFVILSFCIALPVIYLCLSDYVKFKKSTFKKYEAYWHHYHNRKYLQRHDNQELSC